MSGPDLRSFVGRSRALLESAPPTTGRETRTWLVDPFLQTLGWDARADAVAVETTVEETRLEYVLGVDSVPALFVAVDPYDRSLDESRARSVLEAMAWTGVDRAVYTNGREYLFLAGTRDVERLACRLPALPEHESSIEHFSRGVLSRRFDADSEPAVARQLAVQQATLVEAVVDRLTETAGDAYVDEFEAAAERFCEQLVVSFAETDAERFGSSSDDISFRFTDPTAADSEPSSNARSGPKSSAGQSQRQSQRRNQNQRDALEGTSQPEQSGPDDERTAKTDAPPSAAASASDHGTTDASTADADRDDGEYVARFFNDRGSIGAIGHSSSQRALVGVAEYLFERGLSGVAVPWSPDDGDEGEPTLLNADPVRANGEPMAAPYELSNSLYLETVGDTETHAERARALASRAGLRVLLTGDWE